MDSSLLSDPYRRPARRTQWIVSSLAHHYGLDRGVENEIIVLATGLDQYLQEIFHHLDYQGLGTVPAEDFTVLCQVLGLSDSSEPEECSGLLERLPRQLPFRLFHAKLCGYFSTKAGRRYESGRLLVARDSEHIETQIRLRSPVRRTDTQPQVGGNRGERAASGRRLGPPGPCSRECYEDIVALEEAEDRICKLEEENRSLRELVEDMRAALQSSDARCLALQVGLWKCHSQRKPEEGCLISKQKLSAQTNTANVELSDGSNINLRSLQNIINEIECLRSSREQQVQETMLCNQRLEQELWSCKETIAASEKSNKALKKEQESLKNRVEEARQALLTGMAKVKELELKASHVPVLQRRILQLESQLLDYRSHLSEVPLPHREEQPLCVCNRRCCQDLQRDRCSPTGQALTTADRMEEQLFRSVEGQAASDEEEDKSSGEQQRPLERGPTQLSGCAERPCEEAVRKEESQSSAAVDDKTDMEKRRQDVGPRPSGKMKLRSLEVGRSPRRACLSLNRMSSVSSQPHFVFGPRSGGLALLDEHTVLFTCGSRCVMQNCAQRWQRFLPGSERSVGFCSMALSPNCRYLAASEKSDKASIIVFELQHHQGKKRKVLTSGDLLVQEFLSMAFSPDSKYLIAQSGAPEWMLMIWFVEENKVLATLKTTTSNNPVTQISFNPNNNMQICVSGNGVFKMFRYSGGVLRQSSIAKVESVNLLCHTWLSEDRVVAGTDSGRLLVSESGELRREMKMSSKADLGQNDRYLEVRRIKEGDGVAPCGITALLSCSKGFLCSTGPGTVCLFEKMEGDIYRKIREIQILPDPACSDASPAQSQQIDTMCISPAEDTLAVSTDRGQLYSFNLSSANIKQEGLLHFDFLSSPFHSNTITGLSICIRKPLVATSSLDRSVRIWNYETKDLEVTKEFQEEAFSVALHPTGLFILVGFSNKLRLMNVFIDDIRTFKEFSLHGCRECAFSHGGHMFAAVNGNVIHIYSFTSFENTLNLKGHMGKVWRIEWSLDDSRLASCGTDGAVYEWNTQTGRQESESVLKSCSYTDLAFSSDYKTILVVGTDRTLREIQDCQVLREVPPDDIAHTALAVSHSGRVVFTGTSSGTIRAIKYPLPAQKEWITQQAHSGRVTRMVITYDDQFLLSVSEDGCLLISKITDKEGRGLRSNSQIVHTEEILVTKADLKEKAKKMLELKVHLEELHMENEYRLRLKEVNFNEKLKEMTEQFTKETQSLKTAQQILNSELEKQKCEAQQSSTEAAVKHSRDLKDLERSYTTKLVLQHKEYEDLLQKHEQMKEDYNRQLKHAEENRTQAVVELKEKYEARLHNQARLLAQCQEEAEQKIQEFKEILKQAEKEEQKNIHTIQSKYEKQLLLEKEAKARLKEDGGVMTQKIYCLQRQIDHDSEEMDKIKKERQSLIGFIRSLESNVLVLKRQISELEKTIQDKDKTISGLKAKNQELGKHKFVIEFQLNGLKKQIELQQDEIHLKGERIQKLEEEVAGITKSNTKLKLTTSDLRLKLKTKDKEVQKELQKVKNLQTLLERLRSDLHGCVSLVQEPKELKDNILRIYGRYAPDIR